MRILRGLVKLFTAIGRALVPVGLFALLAVGIHAGCDRVDDRLFALLNFVDAVLDQGLGAAITWVMQVFDAAPQTIARTTFKVADFVDLEVKDAASRWLALALEIVLDVLLAVPIFLHRDRGRSLIALAQDTFRDFTLLRLVAPASVVAVSVSGALVAARAVQVGLHGWWVTESFDKPAELASAILAATALVLIVARLFIPAVRSAICWADTRAEKDKAAELAPWRRRVRGWGLGLFVLPVAFYAITEGAPLAATLRSLLVW